MVPLLRCWEAVSLLNQTTNREQGSAVRIDSHGGNPTIRLTCPRCSSSDIARIQLAVLQLGEQHASIKTQLAEVLPLRMGDG